MTTRIIRTLLLLAILPYTAYCQEQEIIEAFDKYRSANPTEKVYLHTDKEVYAPGETLWFAAYLVDGTNHLPSQLSSVVHVELLDKKDSILVAMSLKMMDGAGAGDIILGDSIPTGEYFLRGFTHYQRNFDPAFIFSKSLFLVDSEVDDNSGSESIAAGGHDFQYFPEGGDLIAGIVNQVAIKATNDKGVGLDVEGTVLDEAENTVVTFKSIHQGMGRLLFTPQAGKSYSFKYTIDGKEYRIPIKTPLEKGCKLSVRPTKTAFNITGNVTSDMNINDCMIVGHVRGQVYMIAKPEGREYIYAKVPYNRMPNGIIHLTMLYKGVPMQERLIYNENPILLPTLSFTTSPNLLRRQKIQLEVNALNQDGTPAEGKISAAILSTEINTNQISIDSYLNVFSDLKGVVQNPSHYFNKENPMRLTHLDILMLTQGWRRFVWADLLQGQFPEINYFAEKGFSIEGQIVDYYKRQKPKSGTVVLSFLENLLFNEEATADEDGNFYFDALDIKDSVTVMVQAMRKGKKDKSKRETGSFVRLKTPDSLANEMTMITQLGGETDTKFAEILAEVEEYTYKTDDVIELEEFTVSANKIQKVNDSPFRRPSMLHGEAQSRMVMDSVAGLETYQHVFDMITGRLTGVQVRGTGEDRQAFVRGTQATLMVDGVQTTNDYVSLMDPRSIEFVEVIGAIQAAVYGAGGPIVAFYTRQGYVAEEEADPRGIQVFRHPGYYQAREFYTPNYDELTTEEALAKDLRTTQYWTSIRDIKNGKTTIEYTASDDVGSFVLYVEGLTKEGEPFTGQYRFEINDF